MTAQEEDFVHYVECIQSLNNAWVYLQAIRSTETKSALTAAAYRFALIEYAKPYTTSDGAHRNRKKRNAYKLPPPDLSDSDTKLHQKILDLRNKVLAHSDLNLLEARVYMPPYPSKPSYGGNIPPSLPKIDDVIALIERTLDKMYPEKVRRENTLAQSTPV